MIQFPAEALDEYIRIQENFNDHQIRAIIDFESSLDSELLYQSSKKIFELIPLLGCRYDSSGKKTGLGEAGEPFPRKRMVFRAG